MLPYKELVALERVGCRRGNVVIIDGNGCLAVARDVATDGVFQRDREVFPALDIVIVDQNDVDRLTHFVGSKGYLSRRLYKVGAVRSSARSRLQVYL